jgi:hypothetical protein
MFFKSEQKTNMKKIEITKTNTAKTKKKQTKTKNLRTLKNIGKQKESPYVLALMGRPTPSVA